MFRRSTPLLFLWVLAIALLPVRMADAHLHLCLDGGERSMSIHVEDPPVHDGAIDADTGHTDRDVDLSNPLLIKKSGTSDKTAIAVLRVYVLALVLPVARSVEPLAELRLPAVVPAFNLRPPLRGPPL